MTEQYTQSTAVQLKHKLPETYSDTYTDEDIHMLGEIIDWLNKYGHDKTYLARAAGIPSGTLAPVLLGQYASKPTVKLNELLAAIEQIEAKGEHQKSRGDFVKSSTYVLAKLVCNRARAMAAFGVLSGYVGTGKTRALTQYADENPQTYLVEGDPGMQPGGFLDDLLFALGGKLERANQKAKFRHLISLLSGTNALIILDEAEKVAPRTLEVVRRLSDKARIGVVLAGTEELHTTIDREHGHFEQIKSRVVMWPETIRGITRDDADLIIDSTLGGANHECRDMFWRVSKGSMRILAQAIIPAVRDFGTAQDKPLTPGLIEAAAKQVLGITPIKGDSH